MEPFNQFARLTGERYTVYDPFAECLYCRPTFEAAQRDADKIGVGLILKVKANDILSPAGVLMRYRKQGDEWQPEFSQPCPVFGKLAQSTGQQLPLTICQSQAGFYLGTCNDQGPYTRESTEYWRTRAAAAKALEAGHWTQRQEP